MPAHGYGSFQSSIGLIVFPWIVVVQIAKWPSTCSRRLTVVGQSVRRLPSGLLPRPESVSIKTRQLASTTHAYLDRPLLSPHTRNPCWQPALERQCRCSHRNTRTWRRDTWRNCNSPSIGMGLRAFNKYPFNKCRTTSFSIRQTGRQQTDRQTQERQADQRQSQ